MFCQWIVLSMKNLSLNYLSNNCCVYQILSVKCPVWEMLWLWNDLSMNCHVYEMFCLWNIIFMKCLLCEISCLWNVLSVKCCLFIVMPIIYYFYELLCQWIVKLRNHLLMIFWWYIIYHYNFHLCSSIEKYSESADCLFAVS